MNEIVILNTIDKKNNMQKQIVSLKNKISRSFITKVLEKKVTILKI
jgi:hypothetical protein